jgi:hypothetical protein
MSKKIFELKSIFCAAMFLALAVFAAPGMALAGAIDAASRWVWTENAGWLDFGQSQGNVAVGDFALTGYAWGENIGWVSLNCLNTDSCAAVDYKVANDGEGNLSGYAWGENIGWINFAPTGGGVSINSSGDFSGYAWGPKIGWLVFNCATTDSCASVDYKVKTVWRARSAAAAAQTGGIAGQYNAAYINAQTPVPETQTPAPKTEAKPVIDWPWNWFGDKKTNDAPPATATPPNEPENIQPDDLPAVEFEVAPLPIEEAKIVFEQNQEKFSFLPESLFGFAQKFPELFKTLRETGVEFAADLAKLKNVSFNFAGITEKLGLVADQLKFGAISLFDLAQKHHQQIPAEIIFARTAGGTVDLPTKIINDENGNAAQKISIMAAKPLELIVKPAFPARSVTGVIVLKDKRQKTGIINRLVAPVLAENETINILTEFDYQDMGNGVFTASIDAPQTRGEYHLITKIDYYDPEQGIGEIKTNLLIDPEGYVFEKSGGKETRIPGAAVSLFWQNRQTGAFELWPAGDYQQENPQITDATGNYAFLVPQGKYYLQAELPGYEIYKSDQFEVNTGAGVHQNIELKKRFSWRDLFSWEWMLFAGLIVVAALLAVNFLRDRRR